MTNCGIYKLEFVGTLKVYVGKSLNIKKRYISHLSDMRCGSSSKKLLEAFRTYGEPTLSVLEYCHNENLSSRE